MEIDEQEKVIRSLRTGDVIMFDGVNKEVVVEKIITEESGLCQGGPEPAVHTVFTDHGCFTWSMWATSDKMKRLKAFRKVNTKRRIVRQLPEEFYND